MCTVMQNTNDVNALCSEILEEYYYKKKKIYFHKNIKYLFKAFHEILPSQFSKRKFD